MWNIHMNNGMNLTIPPEPKDLKEKALDEANSPRWSFLNKDAVYNVYVLSSMGLPKYLWNYWKPQLRVNGFKWPVFLKAVSACEYDVHKWIEGSETWEELISNVIIPVIKKAVEGKYPLWPP